MEYIYKIIEIQSKDEVITDIKYHVTAKENLYSVETEGNWKIVNPLDKPFLDITEQDLIELLQSEATIDGVDVIKSRLEEQINYLKNSKKINPPWKPQVFTLNIG
jgi:hypothetical protein